MTRVKVFPADRGGCGWNRILWPAEALKRQGADIQIVYARDPAEQQVQCTWFHQDGGEDRTMLSAHVEDCDIAVLQRPLTDTLSRAIPMLQRQGVKVVVEIDDDFENISPQNVSWNSVHPKVNARRNWEHLRYACEQADLVVVSTLALAGIYGKHGRVAVVPNFVPAWYLDIPRVPHQGTWVGWSGSIETHPNDLQVMGPAMAQVCRGDTTFRVVGTGRGVKRIVGCDVMATGWLPIDHYPALLADFDVGVVPLELSAFNQAKSALKMIEMASVGTPAVVSPTEENVRTARLLGFPVAERPKDWVRHLKRLVANRAEREELGGFARAAMASMTYEQHCGRHWEAWTSVLGQHALSA